ncbi:hypothetical protein [Rhodococcus sp. OK302]|uniref:hypothetical protein n=1 Tax=Rhodococcus sp. OK302 TaxID=1882769 RepID=UPI000B9F5863|nr:hypothetical protein [Rhodococcus sp. OK302]OYD68714.1 hypothetical protein BDB13_2268 [Rhodococcus sp. OK302]
MGFPDITEVFQNLVVGAANSFVSTTVTLQSATDDSERFTPEVTEAAKLGQDERDEAWRVRDALTPQVSALEYSEHSIIDDDPFDAMSHAEIFERVSRMDPGTLDAIGGSWTAIAGRTEAGVNQFQHAISTAIGDGWQGQGGSAALAAVLAYAENGNQLKTRVQLISNKVSEARIVLDEVKRSIPEPDGASITERFISAIPGATRNQAQYEAEEAERRARQVMKDVYLPNMRRADDQVPILPAAFNPITGDGGVNGYPGSGSGGSGGGSNAYSLPTGKAENGDFRDQGGSGQGDGGSGQSGAGEGAAAQGRSGGAFAGGPSTADGNAFDGASQGDSNAGGTSGDADRAGGANSDGAAGTTAASAGGSNLLAGANAAGVGGTPHSNAFGAGAGASPSGGAGSGSPGGSGLGAGGGAFGSGGGGGALAGGGRGAVGGIGSSGIGPGGGGVGGSGTGGGANGRSPAMGGMGGMAGARGQGKDDDDTHQTPGYLINIDNGNTLIGELPMVTPSVLGQ